MFYILHRKSLLIVLFLSLLLLVKLYTLELFSHPETAEKKNRIYIASITIDPDVSETIRESFTIKLKSQLVERFGDSYNIVSQSDLDLLFKQAEDSQKQGRDTKVILTEIAEAKDADEIIHGKIFKDRGQIKLLLSNLKKDQKNNDYFTKSIVDISFFENDFDFYVKEAAIKIMFPRYKVKSGESMIADNKKGLDSKKNVPDYFEPKLIPIGTVKWGNFEGLMKWDEAVDYCTKKGMRLPTPEELRDMAQLKNHILREPCCVFWSSRSNAKDHDYAYYIDINDGFGNFYHKEIDVRVRCVKN